MLHARMVARIALGICRTWCPAYTSVSAPCLQETLFILKNASWFGTKAGDVYQVCKKIQCLTQQELLDSVDTTHAHPTHALSSTVQVIDTAHSMLQNVITFPNRAGGPDGAFIVDSSIQIASSQRVKFQFTGATLKLPNRKLSLPPFGKGWFENVYVDDRIRVAKDVRGDTLIVSRDGPPRVFS